jgi:hypothetical protein
LEYPQHVVSQWIGHSVAVSLRHYVQTPDYLFDMAAAGTPLRAAKCAAVNPGTDGNGEENEPTDDVNDTSPEDEQTRVFAGIAEENAGSVQVVRAGIEPATHGFSVHCSTN